MDFGKYKYEAAVKAREARKNQTNTVLKEIRFRLKIDTHDYETKRGHALRFLGAGDKVKAMIQFRGREQQRPEMGIRLLQRFADDVAEVGVVESSPRIDGRNMVMVVGPLKNKAEAKAEARRATQRAEAKAENEAKASGRVDVSGGNAPLTQTLSDLLPEGFVVSTEAPAAEAPVEEAKVEETKVEETKVEEAKVEEAKVEAAPVEEPRPTRPRPGSDGEAAPKAAEEPAAAKAAAPKAAEKPAAAKAPAAPKAAEKPAAAKAPAAPKAAPAPGGSEGSRGKGCQPLRQQHRSRLLLRSRCRGLQRRSPPHGRPPPGQPPSLAARRPTSSRLPDSNVRQQATSTPPAGAAARKSCRLFCGYVRRSVPMPKMKTHSGAKKRFKLTGSGKLRRQQANRRHYLEHKSSRLTRRLAGDKIVFKGDAKVIRKMLGI